MRKSFSTKLLALIMAVLMLATTIPFSAFAATGLPVSKSGAYLFAYFKDNLNQQKLFLALSKDGYHFEELNGGKEIPLDYSQTDSGHIRDPFIFNADEKDPSKYGYYIIATDMNANDWGAQDRQHSANIWAEENYSTGFVHLNNIDMDDRTEGSLGKLMADKFGDKECCCFWAPEVIWDPTYITDATPDGAYMMSFGFAFSDWSRGTRLYYAHTLDFKTFFDCDVLLELKQPAFNNQGEGVILDNIDSDIINFKGEWYMFFKNEAADSQTDCNSRVFVTKSKTNSPAGPYYDTITDNSLTYPYQISKGSLKFEGPAAYQIDGTNSYIVALDNFTESEGNYELYMTGDFKSFTPLNKSDYSMTTNNKARHASVCHISDEEYDALVAKYGKWTDTQTSDAGAENINEHLIGRYFVNTNPAQDVSGKGNDIVNGVNGKFNNIKTVVKNGKLAADFTINNQNVKDGRKATSNDMTPYQNLWVKDTEPWVSRDDANIRLISRDYGSYASIETADLFSKYNVNIKQGVTIAFDTLPTETGRLHVIDISNAKDYGYINSNKIDLKDEGAWAIGTGNTDYELTNNDAAYQNGRELFVQMDESGRATVREVNKGTETTTWFNSNTSEWHTYSITITKGMLTVYVDGVKVNQVKDDRYDEQWFNDLFYSNEVKTDGSLLGKSKIGIGVSHWIADYLYTGYISNFCIYDRALSQDDIAKSNELFTEAEQIPVNEGQVIYEDLLVKKDADGNVTEDKFNNYSSSDVLSDADTNGYGKMLNIPNKTIDSNEIVKDIDGVSPTGYTYNIWVNPKDTIDSGILMRQGSDQYHIDIKEDGVVEFKYGADVTFATPSLFTLTPNKVQNVTIQVTPYGDYDRITAYVDGVQTGTYDAYVILENNTSTTYPAVTAFKFINMSAAQTNNSHIVRYGDSSANAAVTGVTIHRGAVDCSDLYLDKFASLAEGLYNEVRKAYVEKMAQFDKGEHFWTNMTPAYEAYNDLNRYIDSITYGNAVPDADYLVGLVTKLKDATAAMVAYNGSGSLAGNYNIQVGDSTPEGVSTGVLKSDKFTFDAGNVQDTKIMTGGAEDNKVLCNIVYNNVVFLYDGTNNILRMPVTLRGTISKTNKERRFIAAYPVAPGSNNQTPIELSNDAAKYKKAFYVGNGGVGTTQATMVPGVEGPWFGWGTTYAYRTDGNREVGSDTANTNNANTGNLGTENYIHNVLNIDVSQLKDYPVYDAQAADPFDGATGTIQGEYKLYWHVYGTSDKHIKHFGEKVECGCGRLVDTSYKTQNKADDSVVIMQAKSLYVIDATPLRITNVDGTVNENCPINSNDPTRLVTSTVQNKNANSEGVVGNVIAYDNAIALLKAVDMYTSFDSKVKELQENQDAATAVYDQLTTAIGEASQNYTQAYEDAKNEFDNKSGTIDPGYSDLKATLVDDAYLDNLSSLERQHKLNTDVTIGDTTFSADEVYTTDTVEAFAALYDKAVDHFTSLDPRGDNVQYANRDEVTSKTATKISNEIKEAYSKLMPVADYTPVIEECATSTQYNIGTGITDPDNIADTEQSYSLKSWLEFEKLQDTAESYANNKPDANALYTADDKMNQGKYVTDANGVVLRGDDNKSNYQTALETAAENLRNYYPDSTASEHLEKQISGEALENYNTSQRLAARVDLDAYKDDAKNNILNNFKKGYVDASGNIVNANEFDANNIGVYVKYNDAVYLYGDSISEDVDPNTAAVLNGINALIPDSNGVVKMNGYDVRLRVVIDDGKTNDIEKEIKTYAYGNDIGAGVVADASMYEANYDVVRWEVKSDSASGATVLPDTGFVIKRAIQQNTDVTLYLASKSDTAAKIQVVDYFGVPIDLAYVNELPDIAQAETSDVTSFEFTDIKGNAHTVSVREASKYTFHHWNVVNKNNTVIISQVGSKDGQFAVINVDGGTVNGSPDSYSAQYNEFVTLFSNTDNFFAWIKSINGTDWYIASYDANFKTYAAPTDANGITYKAITIDELAAYIKDEAVLKEVQSDKTPFSFGTSVELIDNQFKVFCDYTVNTNMSANVKVVQSGVVYAIGDTAPENFTKGASGVYTAAANAVSASNTYVMAFAAPPSDNTLHARSYVSYMYTTTDANGNEITVPFVSYGPAITCAFVGGEATITK